MDSCARLNYSKPFFRQSTPSTSYSPYSSPTLSPVSHNSNPQKKTQYTKVFENICTQYFELNSNKEQINNRCIKLIQKQNELSELKKSILIHVEISESRLNFKDLEDYEAFIAEQELINLQEKQKLKKIIQGYFEAVGQTKTLNSALKELMDMNDKYEEFAQCLYYLNTKTKELTEKKAFLESEQKKISTEKICLLKNPSIHTQNTELKSLKTLQTQVSDTKNVVAYLDTQTQFSHSDLLYYQKLYTQKLEKLEKTRGSILRLKSSLVARESCFLSAKDSCKARLRNLSQLKSKLESMKVSIFACESTQSAKETYLTGLESALYSQYEILEKLYICKNLY